MNTFGRKPVPQKPVTLSEARRGVDTFVGAMNAVPPGPVHPAINPPVMKARPGLHHKRANMHKDKARVR